VSTADRIQWAIFAALAIVIAAWWRLPEWRQWRELRRLRRRYQRAAISGRVMVLPDPPRSFCEEYADPALMDTLTGRPPKPTSPPVIEWEVSGSVCRYLDDAGRVPCTRREWCLCYADDLFR